MIIIADSGSTKTSWRIIDNKCTISQEETIGLNPYYLKEEQLHSEIVNSFLSDHKDATNTSLYFYGSGCASSEKSSLMEKIFKDALPNATIYIHDDMLAAARATCNKEEGIVCILGTGSNSCQFDGSGIVGNVPTVGYILGDEGSGSHMGKLLLADFIRGQLPVDLRDKLLAQYTLTRDDILNNVYHKERPNRYLAQFAKFIFRNVRHPYMAQLVHENFLDFFSKNILLYPRYSELNTHFVGSIAWYFNGPLRKAAKEKGIRVKNIIENPIAGLTLYHQ